MEPHDLLLIMKKGFTLIELLVVIAIIGLLSSVVFASLNSAREKARDAKRMADLRELSSAIELFYNETGSYPREGCPVDSSASGTGSCGHPNGTGWRTANGLASDFLGHNITEFISSLPIDPINDGTYYYQYEPHCGQSGGVKQGYWLRVRLEAGGWHYVRSGPQGTTPAPSYCSTVY